MGIYGPNLNWKFVRQFKEETKSHTQSGETFLDVGSCGVHTVHGAMKDGFVSTGWKIQEFLKSAYWLLKIVRPGEKITRIYRVVIRCH